MALAVSEQEASRRAASWLIVASSHHQETSTDEGEVLRPLQNALEIRLLVQLHILKIKQ